MKIIKLLIVFFKKLLRKYKSKQLDKLSDNVLDILTPILEKKIKDQNALKQEIIDNILVDIGRHDGSKFIPSKQKTNADVYAIICNKYGDRMETLGVELTLQMKFKCT